MHYHYVIYALDKIASRKNDMITCALHVFKKRKFGIQPTRIFENDK